MLFIGVYMTADHLRKRRRQVVAIYTLLGTTFVHGCHAPSACCWILRFQILVMQKA